MDGALQYLMEVFVDDFIAIAMPKTTVHLDHLANAMMHKIYDVFPPSAMTIDDDHNKKKLILSFNLLYEKNHRFIFIACKCFVWAKYENFSNIS